VASPSRPGEGAGDNRAVSSGRLYLREAGEMLSNAGRACECYPRQREVRR